MLLADGSRLGERLIVGVASANAFWPTRLKRWSEKSRRACIATPATHNMLTSQTVLDLHRGANAKLLYLTSRKKRALHRPDLIPLANATIPVTSYNTRSLESASRLS